MTVVVIGAGVAGTAAAIAAMRAGADVIVVDGGTGATTLWTGAVHGSSDHGDTAIVEDLGVTMARTIAATVDGHSPSAYGHEAGLLNLHPVLSARGRIGVVRCDRRGWDAAAFARDASIVDADLLRHADERALPDADFAARHDDPGRLGWLADRLREAVARTGERVDAMLLPPSLGVQRARAEELSKLVGIPCGEAMGLPGGPAGLRFEQTRDRALAGAERVRGRATAIESARGKRRVRVDDRTIDADAVVVATGGLVGGGIEYAPSDAMIASALPPLARPPFRVTLDAPLTLGASGRPLDLPGSLFGLAPESIAWPLAPDPLMDRVGVLCDRDGCVADGLYVAGDIVADSSRGWLDSLASGARAGRAAAARLL